MDTYSACACGREMTELVPVLTFPPESIAELAAAPIVGLCSEDARIPVERYERAVLVALAHQGGRPFTPEDLQTVTDQLREMRTERAQALYAILGQVYGVE